MKVILFQNVNTLGKKGDVKEVSEGYARNFLIPRKLATIATKEAVIQSDARKKKDAEEEKAKIDSLRKTAESIKNEKIEIRSKGKDGKLFGSVSVKEIAKKIEERGYKIGEKSIMLKNPIKEVGEYSVVIDFSSGIKSEVKVIVEEDK